jgi:hypothetical protein
MITIYKYITIYSFLRYLWGNLRTQVVCGCMLLNTLYLSVQGRQVYLEWKNVVYSLEETIYSNVLVDCYHLPGTMYLNSRYRMFTITHTVHKCTYSIMNFRRFHVKTN